MFHIKKNKLTYSINQTVSLFKNKIFGDKDKKACSKYTIVSACYNVSQFLDDFFKSIVSQSIGFKDNIFMIMVDDGSTDATAEIIGKWVRRYPNNITYLHKENGGQFSARNLGLEYVRTPWVTFTDPDDFLNDGYFENVDNFLKNNKDANKVSLISSNIVFYYEKTDLFKETHPLSYKFKTAYNVFPFSKIGKNIQLSAASALFKTSVLKKHSIFFPDLKPNFEDGYFLCDFIIKNAEAADNWMACLRDSKYYYRKRQDGNSTLDKAWKHEGIFSDVLVKGFIPLLSAVQDHNNVSKSIQYSILYAIAWHVLYLLNRSERAKFLSEDKKNKYLEYLDKSFSFIDTDTIFNFDGCQMWHYHKIGMCNCFKHTVPKISPLIYVEKYDPFKDEIFLRYFSPSETVEDFKAGDATIIPAHVKWVRDDFLGRTFILQRLIWLPLHGLDANNLSCTINGVSARIFCKGNQKTAFAIRELKSLLANGAESSSDGPWLFMDRMNHADDNAEHLYRYIMRNYNKKDIYYLLNTSSPDWKRLQDDGFNLVKFGSDLHKELSKKCTKIISSHIDQFVVNYWKDGSLDSKQIVFLQHGITKDDLSNWLNTKKRIDLFVTATVPEYNSIVEDYSKYRFTDKEVKLVGFARHDALLRDADASKQNVIMIMPTWRTSLATNQYGKLRLSPDFKDSKYFNCWKSFLHSPELFELTKQFSYKVLFVPHPNTSLALDLFDIPSYIEINKNNNQSIQQLFKKSAMMITDYSSVAFEMGYLGRPVLYYQFDEDTFWTQQSYQKGYFDYRKDGFGAVCANQDELLAELRKVLELDCANIPGLRETVDATFIMRDGRNCERTLEAILALDKPNQSDVNQEIAISFIHNSVRLLDFKTPINILRTLISYYPDNTLYNNLMSLFKANEFINFGSLVNAQSLLSDINDIPEDFLEIKNYIFAKFYFFANKFQEAKNILENSDLRDLEVSLLVILYKRLEIEQSFPFDKFSIDCRIKALYDLYLNGNYTALVSSIKNLDLISDDLTYRKSRSSANMLDLIKNDVYLLYICSESAILVGDWNTEGQCRSFIENKFGRVIAWRILAAKRSFADARLNYFNDVYNNLYLHYGDCVHFMSAYILEIYINSICDKFSKKANSEYLASFLNIYPPLIADETARRHFVEIIEHKQNEIYR